VTVQDAACPQEVALSISVADQDQLRRVLRGWLKSRVDRANRYHWDFRNLTCPSRPVTPARLGRGRRDDSRRCSRDCRHKTVRKAPPRRHRVVQGLRKISANIGVSDLGSITQFFANRGSRRGRLTRGQAKFWSSCGTNRTEQECWSRNDWRTHDSVVAPFHCRERLWLDMRLGRRMGGAVVRPTAARIDANDVAKRINPEAAMRCRSAAL
jgi:hypothetical protein